MQVTTELSRMCVLNMTAVGMCSSPTAWAVNRNPTVASFQETSQRLLIQLLISRQHSHLHIVKPKYTTLHQVC